MTFSCAFVRRQLGTAISEGDGDVARFDVAEVTEEWGIVACGATVREPI